jgi:hypothetical protein
LRFQTSDHAWFDLFFSTPPDCIVAHLPLLIYQPLLIASLSLN